MTTEEMRALDAWIAEHVMNYKRGHPGGSKEEYWQPPPYKFGVIPFEKVPHFTTDPAAALEVLNGCIKSNHGRIMIEDFGKDVVVGFWNSDHEHFYGEAQAKTLELAICKFAKALFSKL